MLAPLACASLTSLHNRCKQVNLLLKEQGKWEEGERERGERGNLSAEATLEEISSEQANWRDETTTSLLLPSISIPLCSLYFLSGGWKMRRWWLSLERGKGKEKENISYFLRNRIKGSSLQTLTPTSNSFFASNANAWTSLFFLKK